MQRSTTMCFTLYFVIYIEIQSRTMIQIRDRKNGYFYQGFMVFSFEGLPFWGVFIQSYEIEEV